MNKKQNIWVIIPAAGVGARMKNDIPKQYLLLNDVTVIEHTLKIFDSHSSISEIIVAISKDDEYWSSLNINLSKPIHKVTGGQERCDTVLNCLKYLKDKANTNDWVLVHDAARPCLRNDDLSLLLETLDSEEVGGILAVPVRDTMKRSVKRENINLIKDTVNRENLWHALTPQMFRFGLIFHALESAVNKKELITDEASAIELEGYQPILVEGHADNLKITRPEDLSLAAFYLRQADLEHQEEKP